MAAPRWERGEDSCTAAIAAGAAGPGFDLTAVRQRLEEPPP